MTSGTTPQCSMPNHLPVRPNPVATSSAMSSTPYLSQISRIIGQYSSPGTMAPRSNTPTGSPMNAATVSGPWNRIRSSTACAHRTAHSDGVLPPSSHRM